MKRSGPIKRKTPLKTFSQLKRSFKPMKRTRLKQVSKNKAYWLDLYNTAKEKMGVYVRPADMPFVLLHRDECDFHHPWGRSGERILAFIPVRKLKHSSVHERPNIAMMEGWLQPAYRGLTCSSRPIEDHPRPWPVECEAHFPQKYKRKTNGTNHQSNPPESL